MTFIVRIEVGVMGSDFPQGLKSINYGNAALSEHQVFLNTFVNFPDVQRFLKSGQGFLPGFEKHYLSLLNDR